jgi:hypothetical protein
MQEPDTSPLPRRQEITSKKLPERNGPISDEDLHKHLRSLDGLSRAAADEKRDQPPQPPEELVEEQTEPPPEPPGRAVWWWVVVVFGLGVLGAGAMTALQSNRFCASLRFCSVERVESVNAALAAAQRTTKRLEDAANMKAFEDEAAYLEGQLQQIGRDGVISDAQRDTLNQLRRKADEAEVRLKREHHHQRIVDQVGAALRSRSPTEQERRHWLQELQPVAATSFSHREAQALRQRLQPPPPPPPRRQPNLSAPPSSPRFTPPALPRATRATRPSAPVSGSGDDAPYRTEPLW